MSDPGGTRLKGGPESACLDRERLRLGTAGSEAAGVRCYWRRRTLSCLTLPC